MNRQQIMDSVRDFVVNDLGDDEGENYEIIKDQVESWDGADWHDVVDVARELMKQDGFTERQKDLFSRIVSRIDFEWQAAHDRSIDPDLNEWGYP